MQRSIQWTMGFIMALIMGSHCQNGSRENVYHNHRFHFKVNYPSHLVLKTYENPGHFVLLQDGVPLFGFYIFDIREWLPISKKNMYSIPIGCNEPFCLVAIERAISCCSADGPDGSFYGHSPRITKNMISEKGLQMIKFMLKGTTEIFSEDGIEKETHDMGPGFAVKISDHQSLLAKFIPMTLIPEDGAAQLERLVLSIEKTQRY